MPDKTRILHVIAALENGGVEVLLYNYFMAMDRSKVAFDFIVHTPHRGMIERKLESEDVRVCHLPRFRRFFANFFKTRAVIKRGRYPIVHVHHTSKSFVQLLAAWSCGVQVRIAHSHDCLALRGPKKWLIRLYGRLTTALATDWFACSEMAGRYVFGRAVASPRFRLVRNAIPVDRFAFDPARRAAIRARHRLEDCFVLLHVGRFAPQKNHDRLVGIFAQLRQQEPRARLLLVGTGELEAEVRSRVRDLGIEDKVLFLGESAEVPAFLSAADVFVLPSRHEGLGMVLIEAQASGLPCVASDAVPREADIGGGIRFLPLDAPDDDWCRAIRDSRAHDRTAGTELARRAGYDLSPEARRLQEWYLEKQAEAPAP
ncbi:MAG: glycosyltransferase [Kiritimatiellae bacterium]|nr:glycosyltransferase [Kiritimatiellia bacterium]